MRAALYYTLESKAYITNSLIVLQFFGYSNQKYFDIFLGQESNINKRHDYKKNAFQQAQITV